MIHRLLFTGGLYLASIFAGFSKKPEVLIKPFLKTQLWNAVSGNDVSTYIRRGRAGLGIELEDTWSFNTCLEFDKIGKDKWAIPSGISNDADVRLWDLYVSWKPLKDKNLLVITSGSTLPQLSREVMTKPWFVPSLEKSKSSTFQRKFVIGTNSGISPLVNAGGNFGGEKRWYEYNVSIIQAMQHLKEKESKSALVAGRFSLGLGQKTAYTYKKKSILSAKQNSMLMGVNCSWQGETQDFKSNTSYGIDFIGNLKGIKASMEYVRMQRVLRNDMFIGSTGFVRISYNKEYTKSRRCEPSLTLSAYSFDSNPFELKSGRSSNIDAGCDFYSHSNAVKVSFHYTWSADYESTNVSRSYYNTDAVVLALQFILK